MIGAVKIPDPDQPITIEAVGKRVTVTVASKVIADTKDALTLREAGYAAVLYVPRRDVDMGALEHTEHSSYCPYNGDCAYYSIPGRRVCGGLRRASTGFLEGESQTAGER